MMQQDRLLQRPIYGGVFGEGRYALATQPCVSNGLHAVRFMVLDPRAGAVLSIAEDKMEALADARRVLRAANDALAAPVQPPVQLELGLECEEPACSAEPLPALRRHVSRRRREIFARSGGRCFYCGDELQVDGEWHVEHQLPRALGGDDRPLNLVAACVRCNLAKSARTAIEFVAGGRT